MMNNKRKWMLTLSGLVGDEKIMGRIYAYLCSTKTNAIVFDDCRGGEFVKVECEERKGE